MLQKILYFNYIKQGNYLKDDPYHYSASIIQDFGVNEVYQFTFASVYICLLNETNSLRPGDACTRKIIVIGSDNGLAPDRRQAITWTNDEILLIWP